MRSTIIVYIAFTRSFVHHSYSLTLDSTSRMSTYCLVGTCGVQSTRERNCMKEKKLFLILEIGFNDYYMFSLLNHRSRIVLVSHIFLTEYIYDGVNCCFYIFREGSSNCFSSPSSGRKKGDRMVEKITIIMIWKSTYRETIGLGKAGGGLNYSEYPIIELQ
jgi:hypothetical protein